MKVAKDLVVSLAYQVRTEDGVLVCLLYTSPSPRDS